jgi:glucose-6-phosphate dehydrogenase assembly protein OpcA
MSQPSFQVPVTETPPKPVDIAAIESELARLWHDPEAAPETEHLTRACMSNLIIYTPTAAEAATVQEEIALIVHHHPSRVLLLIGEGDGGASGIRAEVSAYCKKVSDGRQVCSEHVTISAAPGKERRLPSVARELLIGDLPTAFWWASHDPPPKGGELFAELAAMTKQVIYESQAWLEPVRGVLDTADWVTRENIVQVLADLEWRRLKTWRRLISQTMDPAVLPGALDSITEVRLEHGPHALPKAWMLVGWLACKLGWQPHGGKVAPGVEITWQFRSAHGPVRIVIHRASEGEPKVRSGAICWKQGTKSETISFVRQGPGRIGIVGGDPSAPPRVQVMPSQSRAELVAKQLPDLGPDQLFRETLQVARVMAEALLH